MTGLKFNEFMARKLDAQHIYGDKEVFEWWKNIASFIDFKVAIN